MFKYLLDIYSKQVDGTKSTSEFNLAKILLNHWSHQVSYNNLIKPLLHYHGDGDEFSTHDSVDISQLSHGDFDAKPLHDSLYVQFVLTGDQVYRSVD